MDSAAPISRGHFAPQRKSVRDWIMMDLFWETSVSIEEGKGIFGGKGLIEQERPLARASGFWPGPGREDLPLVYSYRARIL
jgi:hypothetical protein